MTKQEPTSAPAPAQAAPAPSGGPAFPHANPGYDGNWDKARQIEGMTLRQYAAIKLKVPDSGTDWLDGMIRESLQNEFAKHAMPMAFKHVKDIDNEETGTPFGFQFNGSGEIPSGDCNMTAEYAHEMAEAMLQGREA